MQMMDLFKPMQKLGYVFFTGCYIKNTIWGIKFSDKDEFQNENNSFLFVCYTKNDKELYEIQFVFNNKLLLSKQELSYDDFKKAIIKAIEILKFNIISAAGTN